MEEVKIFSEVDLNEKGNVKSEYPAWYFDVFEDELREEVRRKEFQLERGLIPATEIGITREKLKMEKQRLHDIEEAHPKMSDQDKDDVNKIVKDLGADIKRTMFTYTDMMRGTADAHEEAKRMSEPIIELKGKVKEFAEKCNVPIQNGKVSRTAAEKVWKIASKLIDETTDTETLRRQ